MRLRALNVSMTWHHGAYSLCWRKGLGCERVDCGRRCAIRTRPAFILPVILFILLLLGLLIATFSFRVNADLASMRAAQLKLQTRLAAEAGVEKIKLMLRADRLDPTLWYHNPDELNRIIVWSDEGGEETWGTSEEFRGVTKTFRYSIVADDPTNDEDFARFGVTDEQSKLNLNTATEKQLLTLVTAAVDGDEEIDPQEIVNAILDWRDTDDRPRGESGGSENKYYRELPKPYLVKNGPFETVEELLLVKGMTAELLYGEDADQNGLLTDNEDDEDDSYPPDNADGRLNRGLFPYLTVASYDNNVANDNRPRVYLKGDQAKVREELLAAIDDPAAVDFILQNARTTPQSGRNPNTGRPTGKGGKQGTGAPVGGTPPGGKPQTAGDGTQPPQPGAEGQPPPTRQPRRIPKNEKAREQSRQPTPEETGGRPPRGVRPPRSGQANPPPAQPPAGAPTDGTGGQPPADGSQPPPAGGTGAPPGKPGDTGNPSPGGAPTGGQPPAGGSGNVPVQAQPIRTPADLFATKEINGVPQPSPLKLEYLPILMDRTTMIPPAQNGATKLPGLINVNTAPPVVLRALDGLTDEQVNTIIAVRGSVDPEVLATPAWLVTEGVLDIDTFRKIAPFVTARGQQFTVESIGFADHAGTMTRLQVVVDMLGPIPQTIYYRDISNMGGSFPIREEDKERQSAR